MIGNRSYFKNRPQLLKDMRLAIVGCNLVPWVLLEGLRGGGHGGRGIVSIFVRVLCVVCFCGGVQLL